MEVVDRDHFRFFLNHGPQPVEIVAAGAAVIGNPPIDGATVPDACDVLITQRPT